MVLVLGPGVGAGEKEVGVGAQCAEQAGHDCFLGSWVEALVGTAGGRARRNRDGLGAGVEAPRRRSEVEAGAEAEAGAAEGRDFFLGGAGFAWWELRHRNRDGQRMDRGWASVLVLA